MKYFLFSLSLATSLASSAVSQELVYSLGYTDYAQTGSQDSAILSLDYHHRPFSDRRIFSLGWGAALEADAEGDFFAGVGLYGHWALTNGWFIEGSLMPGAYSEQNAGNDLGNGFELRTLLGAGRGLRNGDKVSLAISHKSNGDTASLNPGMNTIYLRWHRPL